MEKAWGAMTLSGDENSLRYGLSRATRFDCPMRIFVGAAVAAAVAHPGLKRSFRSVAVADVMCGAVPI